MHNIVAHAFEAIGGKFDIQSVQDCTLADDGIAAHSCTSIPPAFSI